jgi:type IX secretion system PorP/SprF family membrane protein
MKKLFTFLFVAAAACSASAQQEALLVSQLTATSLKNPTMFNPAAVGASNDAQLRVYHRWQWVGFPGSPTTYGINYHTGHQNSGFGANLMIDVTGPTSRWTAELLYAYHLQISDNARIALGLKGRYLGYQIRTKDINFNQENDPVANTPIYNVYKPEVGAGVYLHTPQLRAGVAADNLAQTRFELITSNNQNEDARYYRHLYATAAYDINPKKDITWTPCLMARTTFQTPLQFEAGVHAQFNQHDFGIGAAYRTPGFLSFSFNALLDKQFPLIISFDVATTQFNNYSNFSYELMTGADFRRNDMKTNYMISGKKTK